MSREVVRAIAGFDVNWVSHDSDYLLNRTNQLGHAAPLALRVCGPIELVVASDQVEIVGAREVTGFGSAVIPVTVIPMAAIGFNRVPGLILGRCPMMVSRSPWVRF